MIAHLNGEGRRQCTRTVCPRAVVGDQPRKAAAPAASAQVRGLTTGFPDRADEGTQTPNPAGRLNSRKRIDDWDDVRMTDWPAWATEKV